MFMSLFHELDSERSIGFSVGRIPVSMIERKADRYGFDEKNTRIIKHVIGEMDSAYLTYSNKVDTAEDPDEIESKFEGRDHR